MIAVTLSTSIPEKNVCLPSGRWIESHTQISGTLSASIRTFKARYNALVRSFQDKQRR